MTRRKPRPTCAGVLVERVAEGEAPPREEKKGRYRASLVWGVNPLFVSACEAETEAAAVEGLAGRLRRLGYEPTVSVFRDLAAAEGERRRREAARDLLAGSFDERARDLLLRALGDAPAARPLRAAFEELRRALAGAAEGRRPDHAPAAPDDERVLRERVLRAPSHMRLGVSAFLHSDGPARFARDAGRQAVLWEEALRLGLSPERRANDAQVDVEVAGPGEEMLRLLAALAARGETGFVASVSAETTDGDLATLSGLYGSAPGGRRWLYAIVREDQREERG